MSKHDNNQEPQLLISKTGIELQDPENPIGAWIKTDLNGEDLLHKRSKEDNEVL